MDDKPKQPPPNKRPRARCPQCRTPRGEFHKMSCTEPGSAKGKGPFVRFGQEEDDSRVKIDGEG